MRKITIIYFLIITFFFVACDEEVYLPKPKGYFRLNYPTQKYTLFKSENCPFEFEIQQNAFIAPYRDTAMKCWMNLTYPLQNAKLHLSYHELHDNLSKHVEDSRMLVYKHTIKANNIEEIFLSNDSNRTYSLIYRIKGNTASSVQFFVTDSTTNFLRGSLYFATSPNEDSLSPAINYIQEDIHQLIKSLRWTN